MIRIFVACHKACEVPSDPMYLPMHVGSSGKDVIPGFRRDDTGDNISTKNPLYCELTGLYWIWKNLDSDFIGLSHYRRYFTIRSRKYRRNHSELECVLTENEAKRLMRKYRVLVPKKRRYYIESVYSHYSHTFDGSQLDKTRNILEEDYPDYVSSFDACMKARSAYIFNMFLMPQDLTDAYCTWLFDILEKLEARVDTSAMTDFDKRYAGRVSERLFNCWLTKQIRDGIIQKDEICEVPYLYMGKVNWTRKIASFLVAKFLHKKYEKSF